MTGDCVTTCYDHHHLMNLFVNGSTHKLCLHSFIYVHVHSRNARFSSFIQWMHLFVLLGSVFPVRVRIAKVARHDESFVEVQCGHFLILNDVQHFLDMHVHAICSNFC